MSRKNSILIIILSLIFIIGGLLFFYFSSNKSATTTQTTNTTSPFGNVSGNTINTNTNQTNQNNQVSGGTQKKLSKLIQIYRNPTSGSVFFTSKNNQDILRFIDRAVGNVYEYSPETQTGEATRVTNTTIPKIQETVWASSGNNLILRYLDNDTDNISSFSAKVKSSSSTNSLGETTGLFLTSNIKQLVINPKEDKIFALIDKSDKSGTYGFTTNLDGGGKKTIFDSPVSYWNISWPKESIVTFTTKPSYRDSGLLYFFNTQNYSMDRILGGINGMSTLTNKDTTLVAYSYSINNSFSLSVYDTANKINKDIQVSTLADKCVWGNKNNKVLYCAVPKTINSDNYPDTWYQGLESFNDNIWIIDTETGDGTILYETGINENNFIDAFDLKISPDDKYLSFSNKNDLSLWLLDLNNN